MEQETNFFGYERFADVPGQTKAEVSSETFDRAEHVETALHRSADAAFAAQQEAASLTASVRLRARLKSLAALSLVAATLPVPLALSTWAAARGLRWRTPPFPERPRGQSRGERPCALVMGVHMSKGLHLCRHLSKAGFRVIGADFPSYRMSSARLCRAIDELVTFPPWHPSPETTLGAITRLVSERQVSVVVSSASPNHSIYDALVREALVGTTHALAIEPGLTATLDDKLSFARLCEVHRLPVPQTLGLYSLSDILRLNASGNPYVLKSVSYSAILRAASLFLPMPEAVLRNKLRGMTISKELPWVGQARLTGNEYSTYAIARRGRLIAYADTRAQLSNMRYQHIGDSRLQAWVSRLCAVTGLDGQVCVDFMEDEHGQVMAIECNPRASTVLTSFAQHPDFVKAMVDPDACVDCITPRPGAPLQYWLMQEIFSVVTGGSATDLFDLMRQGQDGLLCSDDPWSFLGMHALQIPTQIARCLRHGLPWEKIDVNIGKLAQIGGD